jgi:uncharacterized membrane protein
MGKGRLEAFSDHHLLHATHRVNGRVLWANLHLLFWLSLTPLVAAWVGENHLAPLPTAVHGVVLLCAAIAYWLLVNTIIGAPGADSALARAVGSDLKGKASVILYVIAIPLSFVRQWMAAALHVFVACMWFVPDRRIERLLTPVAGG